MFSPPIVFAPRLPDPTAVLKLPVVLPESAPSPRPVLTVPVVFECSAFRPRAELKLAEVLSVSVSAPMAVLSLLFVYGDSPDLHGGAGFITFWCDVREYLITRGASGHRTELQ